MQLQAARAKLTDSRERPSGDLKITTPPALGINWLIPRLDEFTALYPDIRISLIVTDEDLDLSMREADVAIRTRKPTQPDLIQRKLFSIGFHAYCSPEYIKRFGTPRTLDDLDRASPNTIFVHELSSYQLNDAAIRPDVAVVTSFFPEHLNYHGTLEAYWEAKARICRFQSKDDVVVYQSEFPDCGRIAGLSSKAKRKAEADMRDARPAMWTSALQVAGADAAAAKPPTMPSRPSFSIDIGISTPISAASIRLSVIASTITRPSFTSLYRSVATSPITPPQITPLTIIRRVPSHFRSSDAPIVVVNTRPGLPSLPLYVFVQATGIIGSLTLPSTGESVDFMPVRTWPITSGWQSPGSGRF